MDVEEGEGKKHSDKLFCLLSIYAICYKYKCFFHFSTYHCLLLFSNCARFAAITGNLAFFS